MSQIDKKLIAQNTIFMYFRMILIMLVSIYTSRVILDKLGVDDYGTYNAVASIIAILEFLKFTLATSSSRFITYALGQKKNQRKTFSTVFYSHVMLALIIVLVLETLGLLYLSTQFVIPSGRETAVYVVYQISIFTAIIGIVQIPFTASIIAHEQMRVYAYIGIFEALLRLLAVYLLGLAPFDKLIFYAVIVACVQLLIFVLYFVYCICKLKETRNYSSFDKGLFSNTMKFSGWTLIANISNSVIVQGPVILLNLFFSPAIIASKALASQITTAIMQFVGNFRTALNPQIIKSYAAGEYEVSKKLAIQSTSIVFDLLLLLGLPCVFTMKKILSIWLVEVPPLAVEFAQIAILAQIIESISSSLYIPFVASGRLRLLSILNVISSILFFVILYILLKLGGTPLWTQYLYLITVAIWSAFLRPWLLIKEMNYTIKDLLPCYLHCAKVFTSSLLISIAFSKLFNQTLLQQGLLLIGVVLIVIVCSVLFMEPAVKKYVYEIVQDKIKGKE